MTTKLKRGDIVFFCPKNIFFKIIKYITRDEWVHVAIVIHVYKEHVLVLEATPRGVDVNSIIWRLNTKGETPMKVYHPKKINGKVYDYLYNRIGSKYDFLGLLNFLLGSVIFKNAASNYCSNLIYDALVYGGVIKNSNESKITSPHDLRLMLENL